MVVNTAEPLLARPRGFARAAWNDLGRSWAPAFEMAKRDVRGQYRQSLLGVAGVLLPPFAMALGGLGFRQAGILNVELGGVPYGLFALVGVILWTTFVEALQAPIYGLFAEQRLLMRTGCPVEVVVLARLLQVLFNLGLRAAAVAVIVLGYYRALPWTALLAPVGALGLVLLGTAVGLLLAPMNLLYRDVARILLPVTTVWMFISPVYFPIPDRGWLAAIMNANPVTPLLATTRTLGLVGLDISMETVVAVGGALVLLAAGWVFIRVTSAIAIQVANS